MAGLLCAVAACITSASVAGCNNLDPRKVDAEPLVSPDAARVRTEAMPGTLGELVEVRNTVPMLLRGLGLVVGLGTDGHTTMHPAVREQAVKLILTELRKGHSEGASPLITAQRLLDDPDTAVVQVEAVLPPGIRRGDKFDVQVRAWPGTDTKTLEGGLLYTAQLQRVAKVGDDLIRGRRVATAGGMMFLAPGATDPARARAAGLKPTEGRVLGGGRTMEDRVILLMLREPDIRTTKLVTDRVNQQFQRGDVKVAVPRARDGHVEITVPEGRRHDVEHFLNLLLHLPTDNSPAGQQARAKALAAAMTGRKEPEHDGEKGRILPAAGKLPDVGLLDLERLSLAMEGVGQQALPWLRPIVSDRTMRDEVRLAAAEAGARLGDALCAQTLGEFAFGRGVRDGTSTDELNDWQERAVRALAGAVGAPRGGAVLQQVMRRHPDRALRILAYEALRRRRDPSIQTVRVVQKLDLKGEARSWFDLDLLPKDADAPYLIYATQREEARLAIFGSDLSLAGDILYMSGHEVSGLPRLTISTKPEKPGRVQMLMYTRNGRRAPEVESTLRVADLVKVVGGTPPDTASEDVTGLGMSYSEVVALLSDLGRPAQGRRAWLPAVLDLQKSDLIPPALVIRGARTYATPDDEPDPESDDPEPALPAPGGTRPMTTPPPPGNARPPADGSAPSPGNPRTVGRR